MVDTSANNQTDEETSIENESHSSTLQMVNDSEGGEEENERSDADPNVSPTGGGTRVGSTARHTATTVDIGSTDYTHIDTG